MRMVPLVSQPFPSLCSLLFPVRSCVLCPMCPIYGQDRLCEQLFHGNTWYFQNDPTCRLAQPVVTKNNTLSSLKHRFVPSVLRLEVSDQGVLEADSSRGLSCQPEESVVYVCTFFALCVSMSKAPLLMRIQWHWVRAMTNASLQPFKWLVSDTGTV